MFVKLTSSVHLVEKACASPLFDALACHRCDHREKYFPFTPYARILLLRRPSAVRLASWRLGLTTRRCARNRRPLQKFELSPTSMRASQGVRSPQVKMT